MFNKFTFMQRLLAAVFVLTMVAAACSGSTEDTTAVDRVSITIAILEGPGRIDPHFQDGEMRRTMENVYERLIERDLVNPSIFVPRLAASLPVLIDETIWELKLRRGINFHNGAPFDAAAAKYSIERVLSPDSDSDLKEQVETITSVDVVDDYTIRINTDGPDPVLPARLYMVQMVEPGAAADGLEDEAVGTGPYRFVEWVPGDSLTLDPQHRLLGSRAADRRGHVRLPARRAVAGGGRAGRRCRPRGGPLG